MNLPINPNLKQRLQRCLQHEGRTEMDVLETEIRKYVERVEEQMRMVPLPTNPLLPPYLPTLPSCPTPIHPYQPRPFQPLHPYPGVGGPYYVGDQIPNPWYVGDVIPDPWKATCGTDATKPRM